MIQNISNKIECYHTKNKNKQSYYEFSPTSNSLAGKNLLSYNFDKSVNQLSCNFSFSLRDVNSDFFDRVETLDIIKIYPDLMQNDSFFMGVITDIGYSASATGQRIVNIKGKSIFWLFEYLNLTLDVTAMAVLGDEKVTNALNSAAKLNLNKESISIKSAFNEVFTSFKDVSRGNLGNPFVVDVIDTWFGSDVFDIDSTVKFNYPITNNLYSNSVINFISFMKGLLPDEVYEMYGVIKDGIPKVKVREVPFSSEKWKSLQLGKKINPLEVKNYNVSRSIQNVYTVFYSFLQGSVVDSDLYKKAIATTEGYNNAVVSDKVKKYGYKPLNVNFVGFPQEFANDDNVSKNISEKFLDLSTELKKYYENLDEMYNGTISTILLNKMSIPEVGTIVEFLNGEFYLNSIDVSWSYGQSTIVNYNCSRGGKYTNGEFQKLDNITKEYREFA